MSQDDHIHYHDTYDEDHEAEEHDQIYLAGHHVDNYYRTHNFEQDVRGVDPISDYTITADTSSTPIIHYVENDANHSYSTEQQAQWWDYDGEYLPQDPVLFEEHAPIDDGTASMPTTYRTEATTIAEHNIRTPSTTVTLQSTPSSTVTCNVCHKSYSRGGIRKHEQRAHGDKAAWRHQCPHCDMKFYQHADLRNHLNTISANRADRMIYLCPELGCEMNVKGYTKRWSAVRHIEKEHAYMCVQDRDYKYAGKIKPEFVIRKVSRMGEVRR